MYKLLKKKHESAVVEYQILVRNTKLSIAQFCNSFPGFNIILIY